MVVDQEGPLDLTRFPHERSWVARCTRVPSAALLALAWGALAACGPGAEEDVADEAPTPVTSEAISLFGEPLERPTFSEERLAELEANLASARAEAEASPDSADAQIWLGRRTAYLGRYQEAIELYGRGLEGFPDDPRFLRHRGHRYISVRELDRAVADLQAAADMVRGTEDQVEPDGIPNALGIPTSTLQSNIWYHLGLAHYLQGHFEAAESAYRECLEVSGNPDMLVATSYWLVLTLRRLDRIDEADAVLASIEPDLEVIENETYLRLLRLFQGELAPTDLEPGEEALDRATLGYGLGTWYLVSGDEAAARAEYERVLESPQWAAFGYIAAEAELARLRDRG